MTTISVEKGTNPDKFSTSVALSINIIGQKNQARIPFKKILIYSSKFLVEPDSDKIKVLLGWLIDAHCLLIYLLEEKYTAWFNIMNKILIGGWSSHSRI